MRRFSPLLGDLKIKRPAPGTVLGFLALMVAFARNANALSSHTRCARERSPPVPCTPRNPANAVTSKALAKGSVKAKALATGAVTSAALASDAVTANAIAPNSVQGYALGPVVVHTAALNDPDTNPDFNWEQSKLGIAYCGTGERLLSGGVSIPSLANNQIAVSSSWPSIPSVSGGQTEGWIGQLVSNSGGSGNPAPQVVAICLR